MKELSAEVERVLPRPVVPFVTSLAFHLLFMPLLYVIVIFEPEQDTTRVIMLEGGIALGRGGATEDEDDEDWEELLDEDQDDEDEDGQGAGDEGEGDEEEIDYHDNDRFDRWGFPKPGSRFGDDEDDEDDEDWADVLDDDDDEQSSVTVIIDDDLDDDDDDVLDDDDYETVDLDEYDIDIDDDDEDEGDDPEVAAKMEEKYGDDHKAWDSLFSGTDDEGDEPSKSFSPGGEKGSKAGPDPILALIDNNPYDDPSEGNEDAAMDAQSGSAPVVEDPRLPELLDWMPTDSLMAALISLDLLRAREDRDDLERTFMSLGYFRQIAGGSDLSFIEDIDAVLIASGDPLDEKETFIILRHRLDEGEVKDAIDRQFESVKVVPSWYEVDGHQVAQPTKEDFDDLPWIYFIPRPGYVAVLHVSKRDRLSTYMGTEAFGPGAKSRLIGDLERHMRMGLVMPELETAMDKHAEGGDVGEGEEPPVAVALGSVMFQDAFKFLVDGSAFPSPSDVMLTGRFAPGGEVLISGSALFPTEEDVSGFMGQWKKTVSFLEKDELLGLIGATSLLGLASWHHDSGRRLEMDARVAPDDVLELLALVRLLTAAPDEKLAPVHAEPEPPAAPLPPAKKKPTPKKAKTS